MTDASHRNCDLHCCLADIRAFAQPSWWPKTNAPPPNATNDQDARLQAVAETALGQREGAIVVLDPQTGRIRAVVNPELAFKSAFPPGSTIKPFTALAALRAGDNQHRHAHPLPRQIQTRRRD